MSEKFDFSTINDRERFENLPKKSRDEFIEESHGEALDIENSREGFFKELIKRNGDQNTPEWKELLNKIDFELLSKIFRESAIDCRFPEEKINITSTKGIVSEEVDYQTGGDAQYFPDIDCIVIRESKKGYLPDSIINELIDLYGSLNLRRLKTLVHEETHAVSKNFCIGVDNKKTYMKSGFSRRIPAQGDLKSQVYGDKLPDYIKEIEIFYVLNEGVVEKMSREIFQKYLEASNWPKEEVDVYKKNIIEKAEKFSYASLVLLVDSIIEKIAINKNKSEEEVWNKLKKALLEGEEFEFSEMEKLFKETFGENFLKDLSALQALMFTGAKKDLLNFKMKYDLKYSPHEIPEAAKDNF